MRRQLLEEMYNKMDDKDKRLFVYLTMQDADSEEIKKALQQQKQQLEVIGESVERNKQSWLYDFSANIAGNAVFDGAVWLVRKLLKR